MAQGDWVRTVAKQEGIPVYALKSSGKVSITRGIRTLLGIDPSAGALFGQQAEEGRPQRPDSGIVSQVGLLAGPLNPTADPLKSSVAAGQDRCLTDLSGLWMVCRVSYDTSAP